MSNISTRPNEKDQKLLRQNLRNNTTAPEAIFWQILTGKQIDGLKFRRQYGFGPFVLDFYCPEIRLCIEIDGMVHKTADADEYDRMRTQFLNDNDIAVKRYDNDVVYRNVEGIIREIREYKKEWDALKLARIDRAKLKNKDNEKNDCSDHP